jgi:hypothetical protein
MVDDAKFAEISHFSEWFSTADIAGHEYGGCVLFDGPPLMLTLFLTLTPVVFCVSAAICRFKGDGPHGLALNLGDVVEICHQCQGE